MAHTDLINYYYIPEENGSYSSEYNEIISYHEMFHEILNSTTPYGSLMNYYNVLWRFGKNRKKIYYENLILLMEKSLVSHEMFATWMSVKKILLNRGVINTEEIFKEKPAYKEYFTKAELLVASIPFEKLKMIVFSSFIQFCFQGKKIHNEFEKKIDSLNLYQFDDTEFPDYRFVLLSQRFSSEDLYGILEEFFIEKFSQKIIHINEDIIDNIDYLTTDIILFFCEKFDEFLRSKNIHSWNVVSLEYTKKSKKIFNKVQKKILDSFELFSYKKNNNLEDLYNYFQSLNGLEVIVFKENKHKGKIILVNNQCYSMPESILNRNVLIEVIETDMLLDMYLFEEEDKVTILATIHPFVVCIRGIDNNGDILLHCFCNKEALALTIDNLYIDFRIMLLLQTSVFFAENWREEWYLPVEDKISDVVFINVLNMKTCIDFCIPQDIVVVYGYFEEIYESRRFGFVLLKLLIESGFGIILSPCSKGSFIFLDEFTFSDKENYQYEKGLIDNIAIDIKSIARGLMEKQSDFRFKNGLLEYSI